MIKDNTNTYRNSAEIIFEDGLDIHKKDIYDHISLEESALLIKNKIYMHDSKFFDLTLNCCSISLNDVFKNGLIINGIKLEKPKNLFDIISQIIIFISNLENEISGGLTLVNFDHELENIINHLGLNQPTQEDLFNCIKMFFQTINFSNSRYGHQSPYVSLSIGIVNNPNSAMICDTILRVLYEGASFGKPYLFPNVHFRIKKGINKNCNDPFYKLYERARKVTSHQMNPTYILADSEMNRNIDPLHLHVVGCRSRLLETGKEEKYGIGRTNIGAISINLPGVAMDTGGIESFIIELKNIMHHSANILLKKAGVLKKKLFRNAPTLRDNNLLYPFDNNISSIIDNASLAIGFIGGSEMCDVLSPNLTIGQKHDMINHILKIMRDYCDELSKKHNKIFTLIGVSGEGISYHFPNNDKKSDRNSVYENIWGKGFYTNSFHVPVYELVNPIEKLSLEGKHQNLCNGGSISYLEISHVKENIEGFADIIEIAENNNISYLGFNFEKNFCNECNLEIDADEKCPHCNSSNILKIRRVSGYLGYLNSFSEGKKIEEKNRIKHTKVNSKFAMISEAVCQR